MSQFTCSSCAKVYPATAPIWQCDCGGLLDFHFKAEFPLDLIKQRQHDMWRYREAIPLLHDRNKISFQEGYTPLLEMQFEGRQLWVKQDQTFPTGSYKDRGASVLISLLRENEITEILEDSSGNAGAAIAAYAAKAGIKSHIYAPHSNSSGKLTQIKAYGAQLHSIQGSREDVAKAAYKAAHHIFYASHVWHPFFFQGTKTFAYEMCEQMGWQAPDVCLLPAGNGSLLIGAYIGFKDLLEAGIISKIPRFIAVQAENCNPLYKAWANGLDDILVESMQPTMAEGIAAATPKRARQILRIIRETHGEIWQVEESEIKRVTLHLMKKGFFVEPTSAVVFAAALRKDVGFFHTHKVGTLFTGNALKVASLIQSWMD